MIKSACTRASLIPYPVIAAAVGGNPEAVNRVRISKRSFDEWLDSLDL